MFTEKSQKTKPKYVCESCDYITYKKTDYSKHLLTHKHINKQNVYQCLPLSDKKQKLCECGKKYSCKQTLYVHKKKCGFTESLTLDKEPEQDIISTPDTYLTNLVLEVVKNNTELQKQNIEIQKQNEEFKTILLEQNNKMIETVKEVCKNNTNNTNIINSNNKAFNLNVFLSETCLSLIHI